MATVEDVRSLGSSLERSYPAHVRGALKFRVGQIAYVERRPLLLREDLAAVDAAEACEFVVDAWRMVVPTKLARAYDLAHPDGPG